MDKPLAGTKLLLVVSSTDFRDEEYQTVRTILEEAGATIVVASNDEGEAKGMAGTAVRAVAITEPRTTEFSGAVVIGGAGAPKALWENGLVHKTLRMLQRDRRPIGALSTAVIALAKAGLLQGKRATMPVSPETLRTFKEAGAHYEKKPVVIDGDIVTGESAEVADRFTRLYRDLVQQKKTLAR